MDKTLETFLAQSKEKHLKSIGLFFKNYDTEYHELFHQIEQANEEIQNKLSFNRELNLALAEITIINENVFSDQKEIIKKYLFNLLALDRRDYHKYIVDYNVGEWTTNHESMEEEINTLKNLIIQTKEGHAAGYDIDRLEEYVNERECAINSRKELLSKAKEENDKIKDQFFAIINNYIEVAKKEVENGEDIGDGLKSVHPSAESILAIRIARILRNYKPTDWEGIQQLEKKANQLKRDITKYKQENGHWYLNGEEKKVIEVSDEDYERICIIHPPFLCEIEKYIQQIYNKGHEKGYSEGESDGYSTGYSKGYSVGYSDGYDEGERYA